MAFQRNVFISIDKNSQMKMPLDIDKQFNDFLSSLSNITGLEEGAKPADLLKWQPKNCGDIGLEIDKDGNWRQYGIKFTREKLVKLFAGILRKESDGISYLVTPFEKVIVDVKDAHFIAIRFDIYEKGEGQKIVFTTNVGDKLVLGIDCKLIIKKAQDSEEMRPYLNLRHGLCAKLSRPVYYELVEHTTFFEGKYGLFSNNTFFGLE